MRSRSGALLVATAAVLGACGGAEAMVGTVAPTTAPTTMAPTVPTTEAPTVPTTEAARAPMAQPSATTIAATTTATPTTVPPVPSGASLPAPPGPSVVPTTTQPATTTTLPAVALPVPVVAPAEDGSNDPVRTIGRIAIPAIGLDRPLGEGIRLSSFDRGPSHWPGTALPGQLGNVVIGGHRVSHNADFRHLDDLAAGDQVILRHGDQPFTYRVEWTEIVTPDAIRIIDQTRAYTATLFACHPPGSTRERIVVHLTLVG